MAQLGERNVDRVPIDGDLALGRAKTATQRLVSLLRGVVDPTKPAIGEWSIGEVTAHMVQVFEAYPQMLRGVPSPVPRPDALSETYNAYLKENLERDPRVLANRIEAAMEEYAEIAEDMAPDQEVPWHGGIQICVAALSCVALGEACVHGRDIATAENQSWSIDRRDAILILRSMGHVVEHFLTDEGERAEMSYRIGLRGDGPMTFRFSGGRLRVDAFDTDPVDCKVSADPEAFLLVGYGRIGLTRPIATGKLIAYGRKPWLGLRFKSLLRNP